MKIEIEYCNETKQNLVSITFKKNNYQRHKIDLLSTKIDAMLVKHGIKSTQCREDTTLFYTADITQKEIREAWKIIKPDLKKYQFN